MFLKKDYRLGAAAVLAALAVLFTGAIATGAVAPGARPVSARDATQAVNVTSTGCPDALQCRPDHVC
jgi:hypothetical protein